MRNLIINVSLIVVGLCLQFPVSWSCRLLVPAELINGCIFDPMILSLPSTQFTINRENCNAVVKKQSFAEQLIIYFGRAKHMDLDAPNHGLGQFYLHWMVVNVPGMWMRQGTAYNVGDTVVKYVGPDPPVFSGPHRCMVFAYEQIEPIVNSNVPENRARFELMKWIETIGGENVLRGPIASTGFISEY